MRAEGAGQLGRPLIADRLSDLGDAQGWIEEQRLGPLNPSASQPPAGCQAHGRAEDPVEVERTETDLDRKAGGCELAEVAARERVELPDLPSRQTAPHGRTVRPLPG